MSVTPYPLCWPIGWERQPYPRKNPSGSAKCGFVFARDKISEEMRRLRSDDTVLSTNCRLLLNGTPRGDEPISDPGVAIYFKLRGKPMVMATDYFSSVSSNIWRLAMALGYLRGLERHGGATMMEMAFSGFAALTGPDHKATCWEVLGIDAKVAYPTPDAARTAINQAYRSRAEIVHPDKGGTDDAMSELNNARAQAMTLMGMA